MLDVPESMWALVKDRPGPGLELKELPVPRPESGEVLVKVLRTGICGTDLHIDKWNAWAARTVTPPLVPGHEFVGTVVCTGPGTGGLAPGQLVGAEGQLVGAEGHIVCGRCRNCLDSQGHLCARVLGTGVTRDGAFAQYATVPGSAVWRHRPGTDLNTATLFDPFGNAVHAAGVFPLRDQTVAITGAGPIGLLTIPVVRHLGARHVVVTDPVPYRRAMARAQGATLALPGESGDLKSALREIGYEGGFDVGLEMSGSPIALTDLIGRMAHGGRIGVLGLPGNPVPTDWADISTRMLTIQGVSGRLIFDTWYQMTKLLDVGIDPATVVTHQFDHPAYRRAFDVALGANSGKVILRWEGSQPGS